MLDVKKRVFTIMLIFLIAIAVIFLMPKEDYRGLTGKASQGSGTVSFRILGICSNLALLQGWNFVSICSNMTNKTVSEALNEIDGQYRYVMEWNESSQEFLIYSPLAAVQLFNEINENKSYFIYLIPSSTEINPSGNGFENMTIPLIYGWNSPIYPYEEKSNISKYLGTIDSQYRYVMKWNASQQRFIIYSPLAANPEFTEIFKGEGQFIYIENASGATLKYNRSIIG